MDVAASWLLGPEGGVSESQARELTEFLESQAPVIFSAAGDVSTLLELAPASDVSFALKLPRHGGGQPHLQLGQMHGQAMDSLLHLLRDLYLPALLDQPGWPERLKQEFAGSLHTFLATLTEYVHSKHGRTVLYVPFHQPAACERGRVQLLESLLLQWMRQMRALVDRGGKDGLQPEGGPLVELEYWQARTANLASVEQQLQSPHMLDSLKILETAKSPSLPAFLGLTRDIQHEAVRATSNAQFMSMLGQPCQKLAAAAPIDVPSVLPDVLDVARLVWTLSPHYNTPELLTSLLCRISSAVIERCRSTLCLPDILADKDIDGGKSQLAQCASTAASWRELYSQATERVCTSLPDRPWQFPSASIFAHLDAFVRRCDDLQDVCAAQQQFGCELEVERVLAGPHAADVGRAVNEVRTRFERQMEHLRSLRYDVLDVRTTAWYEDFAAFKASAQDLEAMLANIMATSFEEAATLASQLDLLCAFAAIARRPGLRKMIESQLARWHELFLQELSAVKGMFELTKVQVPIGVGLPCHAGRAAVARGLLKRINHTWDSLQNVAASLPVVPAAVESAAAYEALQAGLQQFISTLHSQWFASVDRDLKAALANSLLAQDKAAGGLLATNLTPELADVLEEASCFERLRLGVPSVAAELLQLQQHLRSLCTCLVQQVVRPYNFILDSLSRDERRLFRDRLRSLDRRVLPGVNKLCWSSPKHQTDFYCKDAAWFCKEAAVLVAALKQANEAIAATCMMLKETLLIDIEKKRVYSLAEFAERQAVHQAAMRTRLEEAYAGLRAKLLALHAFFTMDSEEVQQEWLHYLQRADAQVLDAVTMMVRRSLHVMARALQGERKSAEVPALFVLSLVLDASTGRVELSPTFQNLFDTVHAVSTSAVALIECLPRLPADVLAGCTTHGPLPASLRDLPIAPTYVEAAGKSDEAIAKQMQTGISSIVDKVQGLLLYFEKKYRVIWENDKEAYLRRYERANKPPSAFQADIARFRELSDQVLEEDSSATMRFLRLECSTLKQTLMAHCEAWAAKFAQLLANLARRQLAVVQEALDAPAALLGSPACTSARSAELHGRLACERDELEGKIAQCQEQFMALQVLEVAMLPEETETAAALPARWRAFLDGLDALRLRAAEPDGVPEGTNFGTTGAGEVVMDVVNALCSAVECKPDVAEAEAAGGAGLDRP